MDMETGQSGDAPQSLWDRVAASMDLNPDQARGAHRGAAGVAGRGAGPHAVAACARGARARAPRAWRRG
jgi:hypothetical protein